MQSQIDHNLHFSREEVMAFSSPNDPSSFIPLSILARYGGSDCDGFVISMFPFFLPDLLH
jgi:hypothetical protein